MFTAGFPLCVPQSRVRNLRSDPSPRLRGGGRCLRRLRNAIAPLSGLEPNLPRSILRRQSCKRGIASGSEGVDFTRKLAECEAHRSAEYGVLPRQRTPKEQPFA